MAAPRRRDVLFAVAGATVLATGMVVVRHGDVPGWERRVFHVVNDLPGTLYPLLWFAQQLGSILVVPVLVVVLILLRQRWCAVGVLAAGVLKLVAERIVKALVTRQRPGTSIGPDVHVRGSVPLRGESFVSGHAILVAALAGVLSPLLPRPWQVVCWATVVVVLIARIYVGAHNPLDVVCGAALGLVVAGLVNTVLAVRTANEAAR